ncbi:MAG: twitching motility protein PilT [Chloroflexi bacterium]|nr:twitching motility protein PilT [Chloroflexota bacterium]
MSRPIVLDASVALPLVHGEDESDQWRRAAAAWLQASRRIIVPDHFWLEVSNALIRRHGYAGREVLEALHVLDDVIADTVALDRPIVVLALDRAERFGLSTYDAAYLALAESLDADLATMDRALGQAAGPRLDSGAYSPRRLSEERAGYGSPSKVTWPDYSSAASYLSSMRAGIRRAAAVTKA